MPKKPTSYKSVSTLTHEADKRKNISSAEQQSIVQEEVEKTKPVR